MDNWKEGVPVVLVSQDQADGGAQCSICLEDLQLQEAVMKLSCNHLYHESCITPWLDKRTICPNCRRTVVSREDDPYSAMTDEDFDDELGELINELNLFILAVESEDDSVIYQELYGERNQAGQTLSPLPLDDTEAVEERVQESESSCDRNVLQVEVISSSNGEGESCVARTNMLKRSRSDTEDCETCTEEFIGDQHGETESSLAHRQKRFKVRENPNLVSNRLCVEESAHSNVNTDEELEELDRMITELLDIMNSPEAEDRANQDKKRSTSDHVCNVQNNREMKKRKTEECKRGKTKNTKCDKSKESRNKEVTGFGRVEETDKEISIHPSQGESVASKPVDTTNQEAGNVGSQPDTGTVEGGRLNHENIQAEKEIRPTVKYVNTQISNEEEEEVECDMEYVKNIITEVWEIVSHDRLYSLN